jgi:hypothetical protein
MVKKYRILIQLLLLMKITAERNISKNCNVMLITEHNRMKIRYEKEEPQSHSIQKMSDIINPKNQESIKTRLSKLTNCRIRRLKFDSE